MNTDLLDIIQKLVKDRGEAILFDHKKTAAFLADLAKDVPKPQKTALIKSLEHGFAQVLKNAGEAGRGQSKQRLAKKLHDEEGFAEGLCAETLNLLEKVLFGGVQAAKSGPAPQAPKGKTCKKCEKPMQEEWAVCPNCGSPAPQASKGKTCKKCEKPMQEEWAVCPNCGSPALEALNTSVFPDPVCDLDKPFIMPIEDVFTIYGRGTVVTGKIERGILKLNEEVEIVGISPTRKTVVTGIEMFNKRFDEGYPGDNVCTLLRGVDKNDVERGQVLAKPGSIKPHKVFKAQIYCLSKEEGGRHSPFFTGYRPQFYFRTTDITGKVKLPEGKEMVMPGDHSEITGVLLHPIAMEKGLRFAIREGGKTVASGQVTDIIE